MNKRSIVYIIIFFLIIFTFLYFKYLKKEKVIKIESKDSEEFVYNANIIENVNYSSKDSEGNQYTINATNGEIDFKQNDIIFLRNVNAIIEFKNTKRIEISSDYGKYNSNNFDTIFSENVIIKYLDNKITSDYLDLSMQKNSMIISKDVTFRNLENILKADVVEMNTITKDIKIFMQKKNDKIEIKSKQ
jgi:LPS export ABC transporter protein LptC